MVERIILPISLLAAVAALTQAHLFLAGLDPVRARRARLRLAAAGLSQGRHCARIRHEGAAVRGEADGVDGDRPGRGRTAERLRGREHRADEGVRAGEIIVCEGSGYDRR